MELIACFVLIIILIRLRVPVGVTMLAAAGLLSLLEFGFTMKFVEPFMQTLTDFRTWRLVFTIALIVTLGNILSVTGYLARMVNALKSYLSPRSVAKIAPALIGLLPMPGGAMVSAPIIRELSEQSGLSAESKTASNFWWRHIWEPVWPLYQSVILAAAILDITVWGVVFITFPITIACIVAGFLIVSLPLSRGKTAGKGVIAFLREMFLAGWPLLLIVTAGVVFKIDLIVSIIGVYVVFLVARITGFKIIYRGFKKEFSIDIIVLFFGALTLMNIVEMGQSAAKMSMAMQNLGIPVDLVIFSLPFLVGLLTGLTAAYVGVGFPIVSSMFALSGGLSSGVLLAYAGGLMGIMVSPVHLCLVLTRNYFGAGFKGIYRFLVPVSLITTVLVFIVKYLFYAN